MKILIACEFSGIVREAFKARGHDAWSCDLLDTEIPGQHIQGDVEQELHKKWDMIIAHPPCTYLTNSGVRWLHTQAGRWELMEEGARFFKLFLDVDCPRVAIENPIPHKYALELMGRKYDQIVQPWMFGHTEMKATCLWLKGLPALVETNNVREEMKKLPKSEVQKVHYMSPGPERWKARSRTYKGFAESMANQWG